MRLLGNDYNKMEFAGAFGDLGTLIPFVVGYITLNKMDPLGILVAFGVFKIFVGLYFRTPVSVQPMKAIGGMAIAHAGIYYSWDDLGIRNLYRDLLAADGTDRRDHMD